MNRILIIVDMQNDFVTGALGSAEAVAAARRLAEKLGAAGGNTAVIFTQDTHSDDYLATREGKYLPVAHCIRGTDGWEICPELREACPAAIRVEKETFGGVGLVDVVRAIVEANPIEEIELAGVCTDICVVSNALLLKAHFAELDFSVDASCCAGVTPVSHEAALAVMKSCQIDILSN